jgi:hypothetical protein
MKRFGWIVFALVGLFSAVPLHATETTSQCMMNCPPGNNSCTQCCSAQFDASNGACYGACAGNQQGCIAAAKLVCDKQPTQWERDNCNRSEASKCMYTAWQCRSDCYGTVQIPGNCPGEVPPQKCPFNCQVWNPASKSCVGANLNVCGDMNMNVAPDLKALDAMFSAQAREAHSDTAEYQQKLDSEAAAAQKAAAEKE